MMAPLNFVIGVAALAFGLLLAPLTARGEIPCDFKGVSVGDKLAPAEIMAKFGITKYVTDPQGASFEEMKSLYEKYSIAVAGELEDWKIGSYCKATHCQIPYGVTVGNNNLPVKVFVSFHSGIITEIDVNFSHTMWDEVVSIITKKYGTDWRRDESVEVITDYETKKGEVVPRLFMESVAGGVNRSTGDTCHLWANSIDIIFKHHDPIGPYQSVFVIKLDSKNF